MSVFFKSVGLFLFVFFFLSSLGAEEQSKIIGFPVVYYTPETSFAAGGLGIFNFWKEAEGKNSHLMAMGAATANGQSVLMLRPQLYFDQARWSVFSSLFYKYFPGKYFGRGNETNINEGEIFVENSSRLVFGVGYKFYWNFFIQPYFSYHKNKIIDYEEEDGFIYSETLLGFDHFETVGNGLSFGWDSRDYPRSSRSGILMDFNYSRFWQKNNNTKNRIKLSSYDQYSADLRFYAPVYFKNTLAFRVYGGKLVGEKIAFQNLLKLGGGQFGRGYYDGRFRDQVMAVFQMEYRVDLYKKWGMAVFANTGKVSESYEAFESAKSHSSLGIGGRYLLDSLSLTKLRLDLAYSLDEHKTSFYFLMGEAF